MTDFNLIDHPWIPVRWRASENRASLVSLHDLFTNAKEIADLDCPSHERIAIMRLLVCITQAALGAPKDADDWIDESFGHDLPSAVPTYLGQPEIHKHFNLLGEGPRFLQVAPKSCAEADSYPLSKICFHLSSGNNPKLLDHWGEDPRPWQPASATLALLCLQNFFVGGSMASKVKGNGPALKALHMILLGETLADTIVLNCIDESQLRKTGGSLGRPVWEGSADHDLLARLAPIPCALWLTDDLSRIFIDQGHHYLEYEAYRDPSVTIMVIPKKDITRLLRAKPGHGIWRDLHLLTNLSKAKGDNAPLILQGLRERLDPQDKTRLWVGELIKAKDAKIEDSTESTFTVPKSLFTIAGNKLYECGIAYAETVSRKLWGAIKTHGSTLKNENPPVAEGQKHFWHTLDLHHGALIKMAATPEDFKHELGTPGIEDPWTTLVQQAALDAFKSVCSCTTPRQIQAYTAGIKPLHRALYPSKKNDTPKQTDQVATK